MQWNIGEKLKMEILREILHIISIKVCSDIYHGIIKGQLDAKFGWTKNLKIQIILDKYKIQVIP